ncbi:uncharacterized protein Gasu_14560 [Galdieria sulphuraria]|uniref:Uncharacterized protein n=1 Tax=Galdieria sulphuraria TaxID=130081 RepID=M2X454_GALSU|nr:uncharacterized protein Gasu_14560 [Galdieria sulphuraria]EME31210.1 hypothetical protein Gasu_14560 [Galdieria sulphuraria]|eukprot:XP_005707730.1 hypothetical protein Gasu_14560 [Galdieria sulphuraria]
MLDCHVMWEKRKTSNETCLQYLFIVDVGNNCTVSKANKYFAPPLRDWRVGVFQKPSPFTATWRQKSSKYILMNHSLNDVCIRLCRRFQQDGLVRQSLSLCRRGVLTLASVCTVLSAKPFCMSAETNLMSPSSLLVPQETCTTAVRKFSRNSDDRKSMLTLATTIQPILRTQGKTEKSLDFNTLLALYFLTFIALVRLCFLLVTYFQQRRKEQQIQRENEAGAESVSTLADDKDAIENFRRRMNEFSVETDEDEDDELESEEEELRNGRRRSIDGRRFSGGWRKGGMGTKQPSSSSSIVFERPNDPKERPSSGVSPEQIEMLKRMYGGDINVDDNEKDKKNPK